MAFTDPGEEDLQQLAHQLITVGELAQQLKLPELTGTEADLDILQAILDSGQLEADAWYELESLGVAFGNVLIAGLDGLDWAIVHDEDGPRTTLRYRNTDLCVNAVTCISKRVEDDEDIDLRELYDGMLAAIQAGLLEMGGTA